MAYWTKQSDQMYQKKKKKNWCERLALCGDNAYTTLCGLCYTSEPKYEWKMVKHVFGLCNTLWPQNNWLQMKLHSLSIQSKWFIDNWAQHSVQITTGKKKKKTYLIYMANSCAVETPGMWLDFRIICFWCCLNSWLIDQGKTRCLLSIPTYLSSCCICFA